MEERKTKRFVIRWEMNGDVFGMSKDGATNYTYDTMEEALKGFESLLSDGEFDRTDLEIYDNDESEIVYNKITEGWN